MRVHISVDGHQSYHSIEGEVLSSGQTVEMFDNVAMPVPALVVRTETGIETVSLRRQYYQVRVKYEDGAVLEVGPAQTIPVETVRALIAEARAYYPEAVFPDLVAGEPASIDRASGSMARRTCDNIDRLLTDYLRDRE